jgi:hypothetical protein
MNSYDFDLMNTYFSLNFQFPPWFFKLLSPRFAWAFLSSSQTFIHHSEIILNTVWNIHNSFSLFKFSELLPVDCMLRLDTYGKCTCLSTAVYAIALLALIASCWSTTNVDKVWNIYIDMKQEYCTSIRKIQINYSYIRQKGRSVGSQVASSGQKRHWAEFWQVSSRWSAHARSVRWAGRRRAA